ncbi:MAG TPA: TetR/AcrR family transcriptional regulator [Candidatus Acidoferrales bacterium]|nr:TetR/AcrR family transcriptional regulator [Candidatus Acidoferrales bacterium]
MANRRQHIIELAAEVVYRQGFKGTSVENVLEIAGVGKGNFYHYFRSKDELGVAIIGEIERWFSSPSSDEIFSHSKSPELRLADYLAHIATQRRRDNHGDPLGNLLAELGDVEPFSKPLRKALSAFVDRLESVVSEYALERGVSVNTRAIARALASQIHGLSAIYKVDRDEAAFDDGLRRVQDMLPAMAGPKVAPQPSPTEQRQ